MILLTMKENKKLAVVQRVMDGTMDREGGAQALGLSERQMYRLMAKVREGGAPGLILRNKTPFHPGWKPCAASSSKT